MRFRLPAALVAAWVLPVLTHLVGVDAVLPPLLLLGAMSLVRGGRTLLDQLVVGAAVAFGVLCLAAVGISLWPWGLHPVPVAGVGFSAMVAVAAATGRRPRLAWRWRTGDVFLLGASALFAALTVGPFARLDLAGRLGLVAPGEDFARHFLVYDMIGQVGGYGFLHRAEAAPLMQAGYPLENYPQGLHFLAALLDRFWRSSAVGADGVTAMDWLVWCHVAAFAFLGFAVLWAVRRIGGGRLDDGRAVAVFGVVGAFLYFGDPVTVFFGGFPNELVALALLAILLAVVARPLTGVREQVVLVAALLVGVSFTYYMFLVAAGPLALYWLLSRRRSLLRHRWTLAGGVAFAAGALVPVLTNPAANSGKQLQLAGKIIAVDRPATTVLLLVVASGLLAARALRFRRWRAVLVGVGAALVLTFGVHEYQRMTIGRSIYYYEKAYHVLIILGVVGLAGLVNWLPPLPLRRWAGSVLAPALLAVAVCATLGGVPGVGPQGSRNHGSWGMGLLRGTEGTGPVGPRSAFAATRRYPDGAGKVNVDLGHGGDADFYSTLYGAVMQRNYRSSIYWYVFLWPRSEFPRTLPQMEQQVLDTDKPIRFLVSDPAARNLGTGGVPRDGLTNLQAAEYLARKYPNRVEVVHLP